MPFPAQTTVAYRRSVEQQRPRWWPTKRPLRSQRAGCCVLDGRSVSTSFSLVCLVFISHSVRLGVGCANRGRVRRMGCRGMGCVDPGRGRRFEAAQARQGTLSPGGTANGSLTQQHPNAGLSLVSPPINTMQAQQPTSQSLPSSTRQSAKQHDACEIGIDHLLRQSPEQQPETVSYFIVSIVFILTCRFSCFLLVSLPSRPSLLSRLFYLLPLLFLPYSCLLFLLPDLGHLQRHVMHQILTTFSVLLVPTLRPAYACVHLYILVSPKTHRHCSGHPDLSYTWIVLKKHDQARRFRGCGLSG